MLSISVSGIKRADNLKQHIFDTVRLLREPVHQMLEQLVVMLILHQPLPEDIPQQVQLQRRKVLKTFVGQSGKIVLFGMLACIDALDPALTVAAVLLAPALLLGLGPLLLLLSLQTLLGGEYLWSRFVGKCLVIGSRSFGLLGVFGSRPVVEDGTTRRGHCFVESNCLLLHTTSRFIFIMTFISQCRPMLLAHPSIPLLTTSDPREILN
jgi:hypothetical protein